jgi:hypothetical protein
MKHCQWCDTSFQTKISYQIYCSPDCRDSATKEKIAARYVQIKRLNRKGKERLCGSCSRRLSVYNEEPLCVVCQTNPKEVLKALKDIKGLANGKSDT